MVMQDAGFLESFENMCFLVFAGLVSKHGVVSGKVGSFIFACFEATIFFGDTWFPDHLSSCGTGRARKEFVTRCGF